MKKKITQVHGKVETFKPTTLDQIWGDTGLSKYKTLDLDKYKEYLADMNLSDLQAHAVKMGVYPTDGTEMLKKKLIQEFVGHTNSYKFPKQELKAPKQPSAAILKILAEGR